MHRYVQYIDIRWAQNGSFYFSPTGALELVIHEKSCGDPSMCGAHGTRSMFGANFTYDTFCCSTDLCNRGSVGFSTFWGVMLFTIFSCILVSFLWDHPPPSHFLPHYNNWEPSIFLSITFLPFFQVLNRSFSPQCFGTPAPPYIPFSSNTFKDEHLWMANKNVSLPNASTWICFWEEGNLLLTSRIIFSAPPSLPSFFVSFSTFSPSPLLSKSELLYP